VSNAATVAQSKATPSVRQSVARLNDDPDGSNID
jgi:hypothetical protein